MRHVIILAFCIIPTLVLGDPDRISVLLGSHHADASIEFNERNPGVFLTWEGDPLDITIGGYVNSYARPSTAATVSTHLHEWDDGQFDIFAGIAWYPQDGRNFAVHAGDVVPMLGVQARHENVFIQLSPGDGVLTDFIVSFGFSFETG